MKTISLLFQRISVILILLVLIHPGIVSQTFIKKHDLYNHSQYCDEASGTRFGDQVVMGDINNDGYDDVVVYAYHTGLISVYFGFITGEMSLLKSEIFHFDPASSSIALEDLNGDNYMDLVVGSSSGQVYIFYGGSDKNAFGISSHTVRVNEEFSVAYVDVTDAGDYDHDGIADIMADIPDYHKTIVVFGFSPAKGIPERSPQVVIKNDYKRAKGNLGDMNGDGYTDILYKLKSKEVVLALGPEKKTVWTTGYDGTWDMKESFMKLVTDYHWVQITSGEIYSLAINKDRSLWGWGKNQSGNLGDGTSDNKFAPVRIGSDNDWMQVKAGFRHAAAIKTNGTLWTWGWNEYGQLGNNSIANEYVPTKISESSDWQQVAAGYAHTLAIKSDGSLWAWGLDDNGQLGDGKKGTKLVPVLIGKKKDWKYVTTQNLHTAAIKTDGTLWVWGNNEYGQLGDNTTLKSSNPKQVGTDNNWMDVAVGNIMTVAIKSDGTLWAWGGNIHGELGNGNTTPQLLPVKIGSGNNWVKVTCGNNHSLAIKSDGSLWSWGRNNDGQLGDGTKTDRHVPYPITSETGWRDISGGSYHSAALKSAEDEYPDWSLQGNDPGSSYLFGNACGSAGDINGDGHTDIIIGDGVYNPTPANTTHWGDWGRVYIWFGGASSPADPTGFGDATLASADYYISGDGTAGSFGSAVASGDINGDHYSDVAIGDPRAGGICLDEQTNTTKTLETGRVCLYFSLLGPPDSDNDGYNNSIDNCPYKSNTGQENEDGDRYGDACDNCKSVKNNQQEDSDNDGFGDACDVCTRDARNDIDGDGICEGIGFISPKTGEMDNCPENSNTNQQDSDKDGKGEQCDNCPEISNSDQLDSDSDGLGDICDNCKKQSNKDQSDSDNDKVGDICDNCPTIPNLSTGSWKDIQGNWHGIEEQQDSDLDRLGDKCDNCPKLPGIDQTDDDGDGIGNLCDNCISDKNNNQLDTDKDGAGDVCDKCPGDPYNDIDKDGICGDVDNCPSQKNDGQEDINNDGIGDACAFDLYIKNFEVTQAIQDLQNSVPLVYNKQTWVRVSVGIGTGPSSVSDVTGKIIGYLPDGGSKEIYPSPRYITAFKNPKRDLITHTLNFQIPAEWRNPHGGSCTFKIVLNPDKTVYEINYGNNSLNAGTSPLFKTKILYLRFIPITINNCTPSDLDFFKAISFVRKVYPVSELVYTRAPAFSSLGTLMCNGNQLLRELWLSERVYQDNYEETLHHGLICRTTETGNCFGITGKAGNYWISENVSWAILESDPPLGASTAHELGHNLDLDHVYDPLTPDIKKPDKDYPWYRDENGRYMDKSSIGEYGFYNDSIYDPHKYHDFMSYRLHDWISPYHYKKLADKFIPGWSTISSLTKSSDDISDYTPSNHYNIMSDIKQKYFIISGIIISPDSVDLQPIRIVDDFVTEDEQPVPSSYTVELQDKNTTILDVMDANMMMEEGEYEPDFLFAEIPYQPNTYKILIKYNGKPIEDIVISENMPAVTVVSPNGGENVDDNQIISWISNDIDGDNLFFDVLYSSNAGKNWIPLVLSIDSNSFLLEISQIPGGDSALIKVVVNDGVNTAYDESDDFFLVAKKTPNQAIISPHGGDKFFRDQPILFEGYSYDVEDGLLSDSVLQWSSSMDGQLGTGMEFTLTSLSPGIHDIKLKTTDKDGNPGLTGISIEVRDTTDYDYDKIGDDTDNCPSTYNPDQADIDGDGTGDKCDKDDRDSDGYFDFCDNCADIANDQADIDNDGIGNACDNCNTIPDSDPDNIIFNGNFGDCKLSSWWLFAASEQGATADTTLIDGTCKISDIAISGDPHAWHVQLLQIFSPEQLNKLLPGNTYSLSFDAHSLTKDRIIHVYFGLYEDPWTDLINKFIEITDQSKNFSIDFSYPSTLSSVMLAFELGEDTSSVIFDNIKLKRKIVDNDFDGIEDQIDNCPAISNPAQADSDHDGIGDACEATSDDNQVQNMPDISIFPNPASVFINIKTPSTTTIKLFNILGMPVRIQSEASNYHGIAVKDLISGVYLLEVSTEHSISFYRIIIEN